jgi:hypothetical protein
MMTIAINWGLAKCSCPSWSANADESALRSSLAGLDACNSSLHWWFGFFTFLVAFGVALEVFFVVWEYLEELHDLRRCLIPPPKSPNAALFVLGLFGAGLVAAGVSGEFWKESQIATVETCIRRGNDTLFLLLSKEAGDAKSSAKIAREELDAVKQEADEIQKQLDAASRQLGIVEHTVRIRGPRSQLLIPHKNEFVKSLLPFAGQKALILLCGHRETIPLEQHQLAQAIVVLLNSNPPLGVGWKVYSNIWESCPVSGPSGDDGNLVTNSTAAPPNVVKAAVALTDALNALNISTINLTADPKQEAAVIRFFGIASPGELAIKNPDMLVLVVGPNPMIDRGKSRGPRKSP